MRSAIFGYEGSVPVMVRVLYYLDDLTLEELQRFHHDIDASVFDVLTLDGSVAARQHHGATAPAEVRKAVARARKKL